MDITLYKQAIQNKVRQPIFKIEWMDSNENVVEIITPDLISGSIDITSDNASIRRRCNLVLKNIDGKYTPSPDNFLWLNSKFRLYTGLKINNEEYYFSRGIFLIGEPVVNSFFAEKTVSITAYDKWAMLDGTLGGILGNEYIIPAGTNIIQAVKMVLQDAGETKNLIYEDLEETTPYTIIKKAGDSFADILQDLANIVSWEVYYDKNGYPCFLPPTDIDNDMSVWDFGDNEVTYLGGSHKYDFSKIRNYVVVLGDNINGDIAIGIAQDNNPTSPTRVSLIGKRVSVIEDSVIPNDDLATQRANYELRKLIAMYESVDMSCVPIDIIDAGDIVTITDTSCGLNNDRFLVQSINFPLDYSSEMKMTVWKTRSFS